MASTKDIDNFFGSKVMGHPSGLFVLFFTEMWERFSYYGMRALLVLFLTTSLLDGGWGWPPEQALALYGTYTSLVYITPILGGWIADKYMGYRNAVVLGALIMTLGHAAMALETHLTLYLGLFLLIVGNGFFKPNMTSIISHMYEPHPEKKDGAFTIFYMGVNAGAFLGILLCGYVGEMVSWSWGFGLAGIFMFFGMLQFYFAQGIFGSVGKKPKKEAPIDDPVAEDKPGNIIPGETDEDHLSADEKKRNPFTTLDIILIALSAIIGIVWIINDPVSKIAGTNLFDFTVGPVGLFGYTLGPIDGATFMIFVALFLFLVLVIRRLSRYRSILRDKMIAVSILAFFTVFFWAAFEQAGGSMTIFANIYTDRTLEGVWGMVFKVVNTIITIVPLAIITYVLIKLFQQTFENYAIANFCLGLAFVIIWIIVVYMLYNQFTDDTPVIPASWFSILNSLFIIIFAPVFAKIWDSKYNPPAAVKYGLGLILLGVGFLFLSWGAMGVDGPNGEIIKVSVIWLIFAYFFHTMGELCSSPVGLSYVSKLVPGRMIAFMFGVWYIAIAVGNKIAGSTGGMIQDVTKEYSLSTFFLMFFIVPAAAGILIMLLHPLLKKLMHGVR